MVIACNTAHLLVPQLERRFGIKFLSLIETTVDHIVATNIRKLGIIATPSTVQLKLYERPLSRHSVNLILPSHDEQQVSELAIRNLIAGESSVELLQPVIDRMMSAGAEAILLGCTEVSILFPEDSKQLIDPVKLIAHRLTGASR